jgi:hypothetical protein
MEREPQELFLPPVRFVGEQDGIPERDLKDKISGLLHRLQFKGRAYLARVEYGESRGFDVALCVSHPGGAEPALQAGVTRIFADTFRTSEHLDVIVLSDSKEREIRAVARPFFQADGGSIDARAGGDRGNS